MKIKLQFGGLSFVGRNQSLTITPFRWNWSRKEFPRLGGGVHAFIKRGCFELIRPNSPKR